MDNLKIAFICVILFSLSLALIILVLTTVNGSSKCDECEQLPLLITTNSSVKEINSADGKESILIATKTQAIMFDYYYDRREIYWVERSEATDSGSTKIYRSKMRESTTLDDSAMHVLAAESVSEAEPQLLAVLDACAGLAVDWLHAHVYWADQEWGVVEVAALDGRHRRLIYRNDTVVTAIAVDPVRRFLFWMEKIKTRNRTHPHELQIRSSSLKGSEVRTIVPSVDWPMKDSTMQNSIVVDVTVQRIYFLERLGALVTCSYDGGGMKNVRAHLPFPTSFSVSGRQLFWMDRSGEVYTMMKDGEEVFHDQSACKDCSEVEKQNLFDSSFYLKALDPRMQPKPESQKLEKDCLQNYTTFTEICPCPFGYKTIWKRNSCEEEGFFLASFDSIIQGVSLKGKTMIMHFKRHGKFSHLDFHFVKGLMFWFDSKDNRIYKAPVLSLSERSTVALLVRGTAGLAVDWVYDHLYWSNNNAQGGGVEVCRLDGSFRLTVLPRSRWSQLTSLALDPFEGLMYVSNWTEGSIEVVGMDGSDLRRQVSSGLEHPSSLTLDFRRVSQTSYEAHQLFWLEGWWRDAATLVLKTCYLLNRLSCQEVYSPDRGPTPAAMTVFNNHLHWMDQHYLNSLRQDGLGRLKKTRLIGKYGITHSLRFYHSRVQPQGRNYCQGGCPRHSLCLPSPLQYNQHNTRCVPRTSARRYSLYNSL